MNLNSTLNNNSFICDICGQKIHSAEDGLVQWIEYTYPHEPGQPTTGAGLANGFLIVHPHEKMEEPDREDIANGFEPPLSGTLQSYSLQHFYTQEGFLLFQRLMGLKDLNSNAITELAWRLYYPRYEEARTVFGKLKEAGIIQPCEGSYQIEKTISLALDFIKAGCSEEWIQQHLAQNEESMKWLFD